MLFYTRQLQPRGPYVNVLHLPCKERLHSCCSLYILSRLSTGIFTLTAPFYPKARQLRSSNSDLLFVPIFKTTSEEGHLLLLHIVWSRNWMPNIIRLLCQQSPIEWPNMKSTPIDSSDNRQCLTTTV